MHGGSDDFLNEYFTTGRDLSFGYVLADAGFDLWCGNNRGTRFSRKHISLSILDEKFWDFSWDSAIEHDIPLFVERVYEETGGRKMALFTYSKTGACLLLGLGDDEFRKRVIPKVSSFNSIAPGFILVSLNQKSLFEAS